MHSHSLSWTPATHTCVDYRTDSNVQVILTLTFFSHTFLSPLSSFVPFTELLKMSYLRAVVPDEMALCESASLKDFVTLSSLLKKGVSPNIHDYVWRWMIEWCVKDEWESVRERERERERERGRERKRERGKFRRSFSSLNFTILFSMYVSNTTLMTYHAGVGVREMELSVERRRNTGRVRESSFYFSNIFLSGRFDSLHLN